MSDEKQRLTVHMLRQLISKHIDREGRLIRPEGMPRTMKVEFVGKPRMETFKDIRIVEPDYIRPLVWSEIEGLTVIVAGEPVCVQSTPPNAKNPLLDLWNKKENP